MDRILVDLDQILDEFEAQERNCDQQNHVNSNTDEYKNSSPFDGLRADTSDRSVSDPTVCLSPVSVPVPESPLRDSTENTCIKPDSPVDRHGGIDPSLGIHNSAANKTEEIVTKSEEMERLSQTVSGIDLSIPKAGVEQITDTDEEILAKVMKDVEAFEKSRVHESYDLSHEYEDEELNQIAQNLRDWGRSSEPTVTELDITDVHENDADVCQTNGIESSDSLPCAWAGDGAEFDPLPAPAGHFEDDFTSDIAFRTVNSVDSESETPLPDQTACSDEVFHNSDGNVPQARQHEVPTEEITCPIESVAEGGNENRPVRPNSLDLTCTTAIANHENESREAEYTDSEAGAGVSCTNDEAQSGSHQDDRVGYVKPFWIPDEEALQCMHCDVRFSVLRRRHHCRACGKVLCAACCNMRAKLAYMDFKSEEKVCAICYRLLVDAEDLAGATADVYQTSDQPANDSLAGAAASSPVPIGVLKRPDRPRGEPKQVVFSDGIRPGGDLTESSASDSTPRSQAFQRLRSPPVEFNSLPQQRFRSKLMRTIVNDSAGPLPAVLNCPALACAPTFENLIELLRENILTFYLTKNLHVRLKIARLSCCANMEIWSFTSKGLATVGQDEVAILLERLEQETKIPRDVFRLINSIYDSASKGLVHSEMSHLLFPEGLFGCKDHCGFLLVRPTVQCLTDVVLPPAPFLVALLIQRFEVPWAKVFPLRLLLRLGAESGTYPFPVISYRQRKAVFCEVGHTILNVLADFRNFQYTIPVVQGVVIERDFKKKKSTLLLPRNRYDSVLKLLNQHNEHVLALGGNLNLSTDSHFACFQNEEGQYQTYVFSSDGSVVPLSTSGCETSDRKIGASFVVFSGALKTSSGMTAKMSLVEDGILVQILPAVMPQLKAALRDMKDFEVMIGKTGEESSDCMAIEWGPDDTYFNMGVRSPIDGRSLEGVPSVRIHNSTDFANKHFLIRWIEVFFLENQDPGRRDSVDPTKVAGVIAQSLCRALTPHLDQLVADGLDKIGLRVSLDPEQVGYEVGSNGQPLPAVFVSELDSALIPVITGNFLSAIDALLVMELFFSVILK